MIPFRRANRQYLELVLTLQNRADAADGIGEILRATVHGKFEENNQHTNMISIMIPTQTLKTYRKLSSVATKFATNARSTPLEEERGFF
jgi:hypothetical protein